MFSDRIGSPRERLPFFPRAAAAPAAAGGASPPPAAIRRRTIGSRSTLCRWHAIRRVMGICLTCSRCSGLAREANPLATNTSTVSGQRVRISPTRMSGWMSMRSAGGRCPSRIPAGEGFSSSVSSSRGGAISIVAPRLTANIAAEITESPANRTNPVDGSEGEVATMPISPMLAR